MSSQQPGPSLNQALNDLRCRVRQAARVTEGGRAEDREREAALVRERADCARLIDEFLSVLGSAGRPGITSIRRMRVKWPGQLAIALTGSQSPSGKKAGSVEGWIIRPYSRGESGYEWDVPAKAGLLVGLDGRIHEFSDALWGRNKTRPEIHLYPDEHEAMYRPGVDDLPVSAPELARLLAECLDRRNIAVQPDRVAAPTTGSSEGTTADDVRPPVGHSKRSVHRFNVQFSDAAVATLKALADAQPPSETQRIRELIADEHFVQQFGSLVDEARVLLPPGVLDPADELDRALRETSDGSNRLLVRLLPSLPTTAQTRMLLLALTALNGLAEYIDIEADFEPPAHVTTLIFVIVAIASLLNELTAERE
jgi:hypothetical protein